MCHSPSEIDFTFAAMNIFQSPKEENIRHEFTIKIKKKKQFETMNRPAVVAPREIETETFSLPRPFHNANIASVKLPKYLSGDSQNFPNVTKSFKCLEKPSKHFLFLFSF